MRIIDSIAPGLRGLTLCVAAAAILKADCNTLVYGGVGGNPSDQGAYDSWSSETYRLDGNHIISYSYTTISGVNSGLVRPQAITYLYLGGTLTFINNATNTIYGGTYSASDTSQLFWNNNYYLGTYQLGSPNAYRNDHWGDSPVCTGLGFPYSAIHYYDYGNTYTAFKPTINVTGVPSATSWGVWYLGGAPSIDGYYTQLRLTGHTNWGTDTSPIAWTTILGGDKININPTSGTPVLVTALAPSGSSITSGYAYDIVVQITTDGLPSDGFPITNNAPSSLTRGDLGAVAVTYGWENDFSYSIYDLAGNKLVPITLHETFENNQFLSPFSSVLDPSDPNYSNWLSYPPTPSAWSTADWVTIGVVTPYFIDHVFTIDSTGAMIPTPVSFSTSPRAVNNISQKFFIGDGTANSFSGQCVQKGKITYFTDHGEITSVSPVVQSDCAQGNFGNQ